MPRTRTGDLDLPDAVALRQRLRAGEISAVELVAEHLDRLEAVQRETNAAVRIRRERALAEAENPGDGPLAGLPISIKECFALAGEDVRLGSIRMPPIRDERDAAAVDRLRRAGAIVIARSNTPEMLMNAETDNLLWGRTSNPLDTDRVPGGSSGGEGALVGAGASVFGLGTDILGSIRFPAAFCGVVGLRPASAAVDKTGMYPEIGGFAGTWNAAGPLTRSVRDARLVYNVLADEPVPDEARSPEGLRLIVPDNFPRRSEARCIESARDAGESALLQAGMHRESRDFGDVRGLFFNLPRYIVPAVIDELRRMLTTADGETLSLAREAWRHLRHRPTVYPGLMSWFLLAPLVRARGAGVDKLVRRYEAARRRYRDMLGDDGVLILPTLGMLAPPHGRINGKTLLRPGVNGLITAHTMANYLDLPSITVPAWAHADPETGLPPAVMLLCAPGAEARLLDAAEAVERAVRFPAPG